MFTVLRVLFQLHFIPSDYESNRIDNRRLLKRSAVPFESNGKLFVSSFVFILIHFCLLLAIKRSIEETPRFWERYKRAKIDHIWAEHNYSQPPQNNPVEHSGKYLITHKRRLRQMCYSLQLLFTSFCHGNIRLICLKK